MLSKARGCFKQCNLQVSVIIKKQFCYLNSSASSASSDGLPAGHAVISTFDMFSIGIGPSSSHTVGPMRAAKKFIDRLKRHISLTDVVSVKIDLYGSLACTGIGHHTDFAILMGLEGNTPELIDPNYMRTQPAVISKTQTLKLNNEHDVAFIPLKHLLWHPTETLPFHTNGMRFTAYKTDSLSEADEIFTSDFYSVGGGFVTEGDPEKHNAFRFLEEDAEEIEEEPPYIFKNATQLFSLARAHNLTISQLVFENEKRWRSEADIKSGLMGIWSCMDNCIINGMTNKGLLKTTTRRAAQLKEKLIANAEEEDFIKEDWLYCWAMAVNEENAGGNRVVTAPTNGAAGVIPAVIKYYTQNVKGADDNGVMSMLLTCSALGMLYKRCASISAAEMGCQGEIGVAASMAAGALCEVMGGTLPQVEAAAEIAMEHSLGLTCDPIGGYVEIPCIERNALGSHKAVTSARLAMYGDGKTTVSLDQVINAMRETGRDMMTKYKETSMGGLAVHVNIPEC